MESDDRFRYLANDPRFKQLRKKQKKIEVDDRFQSMFTDEKFTLKHSKDKRGWNNKKQRGEDLKKYYSLDTDGRKKNAKKISKDVRGRLVDAEDEKDDSQCEVLDEQATLSKSPDLGEADRGAAHNQKTCDNSDDDDEEEDECDEENESEADDSDGESELSTSSDEPESDEERLGDEIDIERIRYDWQPLDHDADTTEETSRRLAIQNLDWDHIDVRDVYTLVNSIRPPVSVKLYISEFGKERLAREEKEGPEELADLKQVDEDEEELKKLEAKMKLIKDQDKVVGKKFKINEYEDADEIKDANNEELRERVRRYQLNRMKYYYAIAEFDSADSAEAVYKELDGMDYEGSSLELDLRFVPDEMEFSPDDLKGECNKAPDLATYKAPQFINSALQQTTVKFTWDETDIKRQEKLRRAYTKHELEIDDLEAYLASETDSEEDEDEVQDDLNNDRISVVTGNSEARVSKYKMLLKNLEEEEARKKKVDVDVVWGDYDQDEAKAGALVGHEVNEDDEDDDGDDDDDDDDDDDEEEEEEGDDGERESSDAEDEELESDYVDEPMYEDAGEEGGSVTDEELENASASSMIDNRRQVGDRRKNRKEKKKRRAVEADGKDEDLDLLMMDVNRRPNGDDFKFDPDDNRFRAIYDSSHYNIDPSHPNFKRTKAFEQIAEKKRSKRQRR